MNTNIEATTPKRRRTSARVQIRLSAVEKAELEASARRAGYARLAPYLIDLHRGLLGPASPLNTDAVRTAVRAEIEAVAARQVADLTALVEQIGGLREATKENFGRLVEHLKTLAARLPPAPRIGG